MSDLMSAGIRIDLLDLFLQKIHGDGECQAPVLEGSNFETQVTEAEAYLQITQKSSEENRG